MHVKKSSYRQSGWKHLQTGEIHEFYGEAQPPQDGSYQKIWDNLVEEIVTVTPVGQTAESVAELK